MHTTEITYTLLTDGSSDNTLMHIIDWTFNQLVPKLPVQKQFADLRCMIKPPPNDKLNLRIAKAVELFPCNILFVHRDAEKSDDKTFQNRITEIQSSYECTNSSKDCKLVKIIPIRMMETWLLIDINAIKIAAGNRNSKSNIQLPVINKLESLSEPKILLHNLIKEASELKGRRFAQLNVNQAVHLVAENISDFSVLRSLSAFRIFESELKHVLIEMGHI